MDNPKVSVLVPMYNRKHYIKQCLDSALNQTFQGEYEIIVRDDGSTDGSYNFVAETYAKQISEGKIKLYRNEKNIGEFPTDSRLIDDSKGKYIMLLHSDDMCLPYTLKHLYEVAEEYKADVVHESFCFKAPHDVTIEDVYKLTPHCLERNVFQKVTLMPSDPLSRFNEWYGYGTFHDLPYNFFNRQFIIDNDIEFKVENRYVTLLWIMQAKIFVKTPVVCYVYRNSPDSLTNSKFNSKKMERFISGQVEILRGMDKNFEKIEFFRNNKHLQYIAKAQLLFVVEDYQIDRHKTYADGITPELYEVTAETFKKIFGEDYFYPMFLFNLAHVRPFGRSVYNINFDSDISKKAIGVKA